MHMPVINSEPSLSDFFREAIPNIGTDASFQCCVTISRALLENQCCPRCCLRFLGCALFPLYSLEESELHTNFNNAIQSIGQSELPAYNSHAICTACLGCLQSIPEYTEAACEELKRQDFKVDSVWANCTLPISVLTRSYILKKYILESLVETQSDNAPLIRSSWEQIDTKDPRDSFKYLFGVALRNKTGLPSGTEAGFRMTVVIKHTPTAKEHWFLANLKVPLLNIRTIIQKDITLTVGDSRPSVIEALKRLDYQEAKSVTAVPPTYPTERAQYDSVEFMTASTYVGGRYLKYSREYSQTPWSARGKKLSEYAVSDCFAELIRKRHRADSTKLVTAGREDANVRMLGTGRPFYLELVNPRSPRLSESEYQQLQHEINSQPIHKDNVQVRDLCFIEKRLTKYIKEGEETKTKQYRALVWLSEPLTDELVERINEVGSKPFTIQQKTPIRVFLNRATAVRTKTVHQCTISRVRDDVDMDSPEARYGVLKLHTQAGTYIKEFVHGDLGRTMPNLASVASIHSADLIDLDVMSIDLEWPVVREEVEADEQDGSRRRRRRRRGKGDSNDRQEESL